MNWGKKTSNRWCNSNPSRLRRKQVFYTYATASLEFDQHFCANRLSNFYPNINNDHWTIGRGGDNPKELRGGSIDYQRRRQNLLLLGGAFILRVSGTLKCRSNGTEGLSTPHDGTSFSTQLPSMSIFFS
ncbi:hypothetical protein TNCV_3336681 [Trichonephila clavipes]|nr:hypothetical protein TNCV_3336681 [Trichonephila clavipes]